MKFTPFDLAAVVVRYNQIHATDFAPDHSFDLISLNKSMRQALQQTIDSFEKCAQNTCGALATDDRNKVKDNIYSDIQLDKFKNVRTALGAVGADDRKLRAHHWYAKNQQRLLNDSLWDDFERSAKDNSITGNVMFLKCWWRRQEDFAHFTSQGVWYVATHHVSAFSDFENVSSYELLKMKRKIPEMIYKEYNEYLNTLRTQIKMMKEALCWSMLARLEVAENNGDLSFDDVILHLARKLDTNNLLKTNNGFLNTERHGLTSELFNLFHSYILYNGNKEQIESLLKRKWFNSNANCSMFRTDKQMLVLPKKIVSEQLVPKKVRLKFIFRYKHFRYQFFGDKLALMAQLEQLSDDKSHLKIEDIKTLKQLLRRFTDAAEKLKILDNKAKRWQPRGLLKYICTRTRRFVDLWNEFSKGKKQQLIAKQADAVIHFGEIFVSRYERASDIARVLPIDQVHYLQDYIQQLLVRCHDQNRCKSLRFVLQSLLDLKNQALNQGQEIAPQVSKVEQVKSTNVAKQEGVLETIQSLQLFALPKDKYDELLYSIHSACCHIVFESSAKDSKVIHDSMEALFVQYLEHSIKLAAEQNQLSDHYLVELDNLLTKFAAKHIVDRLCELRSLRENYVDIDVYQLKCESFRYSYLEDGLHDSQDVSGNPVDTVSTQSVDEVPAVSPISAVV